MLLLSSSFSPLLRYSPEASDRRKWTAGSAGEIPPTIPQGLLSEAIHFSDKNYTGFKLRPRGDNHNLHMTASVGEYRSIAL